MVSDGVWPEGSRPIVDHVKGLGMEFGLWFEPEMVNVDSDLVRAHPDWVLGPRAGRPRAWRHQHVLDLANPEAAAHVEGQISALVGEYGIDFIKWDHNRDLHEAVRTDAGGVDRPAVHAQTLAFYGLLDRLRAAHPDLEIESCSSGGARVDLGVLARTDRIWTSDCNDALERAADPALDVAARAGRADGHPHRAGHGAHDPPHPRPVVPHAAWRSRATPGSSGTSPGAPPTSSRPWPPGRGSTASCGRCCTPATSCAPTPPTSRACS